MLQNVQTNRTIRVNVRMEHFSQEFDFRCFIRVFLCELNSELKTSAIPNGIIWTENDGLPVEQAIAARCGLNRLRGRVLVHFLQVFEKTSLRVRTHIT